MSIPPKKSIQTSDNFGDIKTLDALMNSLETKTIEVSMSGRRYVKFDDKKVSLNDIAKKMKSIVSKSELDPYNRMKGQQIYHKIDEFDRIGNKEIATKKIGDTRTLNIETRNKWKKYFGNFWSDPKSTLKTYVNSKFKLAYNYENLKNLLTSIKINHKSQDLEFFNKRLQNHFKYNNLEISHCKTIRRDSKDNTKNEELLLKSLNNYCELMDLNIDFIETKLKMSESKTRSLISASAEKDLVSNLISTLKELDELKNEISTTIDVNNIKQYEDVTEFITAKIKAFKTGLKSLEQKENKLRTNLLTLLSTIEQDSSHTEIARYVHDSSPVFTIKSKNDNYDLTDVKMEKDAPIRVLKLLIGQKIGIPASHIRIRTESKGKTKDDDQSFETLKPPYYFEVSTQGEPFFIPNYRKRGSDTIEYIKKYTDDISDRLSSAMHKFEELKTKEKTSETLTELESTRDKIFYLSALSARNNESLFLYTRDKAKDGLKREPLSDRGQLLHQTINETLSLMDLDYKIADILVNELENELLPSSDKSLIEQKAHLDSKIQKIVDNIFLCERRMNRLSFSNKNKESISEQFIEAHSVIIENTRKMKDKLQLLKERVDQKLCEVESQICESHYQKYTNVDTELELVEHQKILLSNPANPKHSIKIDYSEEGANVEILKMLMGKQLGKPAYQVVLNKYDEHHFLFWNSILNNKTKLHDLIDPKSSDRLLLSIFLQKIPESYSRYNRPMTLPLQGFSKRHLAAH